jgi:HK97 family phage major capsid protein
MDPDVVNGLKEQIDGLLAGRKEWEQQHQDRLDAAAERSDKNAEAIQALSESVQKQTDWIADVEGKANSRRHPVTPDGDVGESDTLLNLLDDKAKQAIPYVKALRQGDRVAKELGGGRRGAAMSRIAQDDPIAFVGSMQWFRARIKAVHHAMKAQIPESNHWREYADKVADALGGYAAEAKAALQEDTDTEGGYLVPVVTEAMLGRVIGDNGVVRASGPTVIQMSTKQHELPTLDNDFTVTIEGEEATIADSGPTDPYGQSVLTAKKFTGLVTASTELLQDSVLNIGDFVLTHLLEKVARKEDTEALEGDGTAFTGLFSVSGTNSVAGGSDALTFPEIVSTIYGGEEQATRDGGVFWMHPWILRDAIQLTTGAGGSVYLPFVMQNVGTISNLLGFPAFATAAISRLRTANDTTVYFGNPAGIVIGDRTGSTFDVNPWAGTEFKAGQVLMRLIKRTGITIWVPSMFTKLTAVTVTA